MDELLEKLENAEYEITEVKKGERIKNAPLPFTTSTLQQEAAKTLNFSTQKTMRLAQQLYEGVDIKGNGTVGIITYLRTDSTRISHEADEAAREYIGQQYGEEYVSKTEKSVKKEREDPGCTRGNPSDRHYQTAGYDQGISFQRSVPPVSADMEAFYSQQNGSGEI